MGPMERATNVQVRGLACCGSDLDRDRGWNWNRWGWGCPVCMSPPPTDPIHPIPTHTQVAVRCRPISVDEEKRGFVPIVSCDTQKRLVKISYGARTHACSMQVQTVNQPNRH